MIKRKGQIVPRYLAKSIEKKAQHIVKFGCDVEIVGRKIIPLTEGPVICVPGVTHVNKKKNQVTSVRTCQYSRREMLEHCF